MIVAIDGPAATGKSTIAKELSKIINFHHLNSGLIYRAVTYIILKDKILNSDLNKIENILNDNGFQVEGFNFNIIKYKSYIIKNENLYTQLITNNISFYSKNKFIREYVTNVQRNLSKTFNIVCEGRDIGSVVFPEADYKFFIIANISTRVNRRFIQYNQNKEWSNPK